MIFNCYERNERLSCKKFCLRGIQVCLSGLNDFMRPFWSNLIVFCGGVVVNELRSNGLLWSETELSPSTVAGLRTVGVKLVRAEWFWSLVAKKRWKMVTEVGFSGIRDSNVFDMVAFLGGVPTPLRTFADVRRLSYLVVGQNCSRGATSKYVAAKKFGVPVVSLDWLMDSTTKGCWVEEDSYLLVEEDEEEEQDSAELENDSEAESPVNQPPEENFEVEMKVDVERSLIAEVPANLQQTPPEKRLEIFVDHYSNAERSPVIPPSEKQSAVLNLMVFAEEKLVAWNGIRSEPQSLFSSPREFRRVSRSTTSPASTQLADSLRVESLHTEEHFPSPPRVASPSSSSQQPPVDRMLTNELEYSKKREGVESVMNWLAQFSGKPIPRTIRSTADTALRNLFVSRTFFDGLLDVVKESKLDWEKGMTRVEQFLGQTSDDDWRTPSNPSRRGGS